ncbi:MAG: chorismate synthase [Methanobacteriota archaeon]|nr:MAG: chorismate synthase [Euryarchaeota archaeon]
MSGNSFGEVFRITTFGESHGTAVGVVIDGCPAGLELSEADVQRELDRRRPGQSRVTTERGEPDRVAILSGLFEGRTTGTPIAMVLYNEDKDSKVYEAIKDTPRPNHADYTYQMKYGLRDWRGGGRSSGRETAGRVAAGAVAKKLLRGSGIEILGHTVRIHKIEAGDVTLDEIRRNPEENPVRCADLAAAKRMEEAIMKAKAEGDSVGGVVEVIALGAPPGLGEPVFDKLDADIAKALMSIGAVKGVEIGAGFAVAGKRGSENNDEFALAEGRVVTKTNNSGGIQGGISNGMPIVVRAAVKPTSSIAREQGTVDLQKMEETRIKITGRHDPCIVPRVLPVCEAMTAIVLADHLLRNRAAKV